MPNQLITNARIVLPDQVVSGSLRVVGGQIADIAHGPAQASGAIDAEGDLLIPGLIELHTDNLERHIMPRPEVDWPYNAAILAHDGELASTGITTVFDAMRLGVVRGVSSVEKTYARALATALWRMRDAGALRISHFLHLRAEICSLSLADEIAAFGPEDRVGIVSLMDHTPGQRQFRDMDKLRVYTKGKRGISDDQFDAHVAELREQRRLYGDKHELFAVQEAARFGAALASHDDTTQEHVAKSAGLGIRFAEFPTTFEAAQACRDHGIAVMMGAPNLIRGASHSGNVAAHELAGAGLVDILSSDYVPAALIHGAFRLAELWGDIPRAISTVTSAPASAAKLRDRGRLEVGLRADLLRVALVDGCPVVRGVWSNGRRVG